MASGSTERWRLNAKRALVTGGTKGIGRAVVEELASLGATVITCSRNGQDVEKCVEELRAKGMDVHGIEADVTSNEGRERLEEKAAEVFGGKLDILVNNVGTNIRRPTVEYTEEEYRWLMDTNLNSLFLLTKRLHPLLVAAGSSGGASVVNVSSVAGQVPIKSGGPYALTKAAMNQLTRYLSCEWAPDGIRVNAVAPWYTHTRMVKPALEDAKKMQEILDRTPMGRMAEASEVSALVAFLSMQGASYITGQVIATDGGFTANGMMT